MRVQHGMRVWLGLATLLGVLVAGADAARAAAPRNPEAEIERLRAQVAMLEREATVGRVETTRLRAEVDRLEAEVDELRRQLEAARRRGPQVVDEDEPTALPLETGPVIEESAIEVEPVVTVAEPLPQETSPTTSPVEGDTRSAQEVYDDGYTRFHEKRYAEAEQVFERFLALFPTSDLADNALFWIGECRYARGDQRGALDAFTMTVERYPEGNKVPDAMIKAGKCFEALGELDAARDTYEELRRRFPTTGAATTAAERLKAIAQKPTP